MSYQIKNIALTALNQAKLGEFHMATATQAAETQFSESISSLYARYKALCTTYSTLIKGSYGSDYTAKMQTLDGARDSLFGSIRSLLGYLAKYNDKTVQLYYEESVARLLNLYKGNISTESYSEETAHIRAFLDDVRVLDQTMLTKAHITEDMLTELETLNDTFHTMYVKRNEERGEVSADEIRQTGLKLNDLYSLVVASATVTANADVTEENQTQVNNAIRFINTQNEHIDYQYRYYIGGNSATGGSEDEGSGSGENQSGQNSQSNQNSQSTQNSENSNSNSGSGSNSGDDDGDENYML